MVRVGINEAFSQFDTHSELSFSIDQQRVRVLASVGSQTARESLHSILMHPIRQQHDVGGQIVVVQMGVRILGGRLTDDDATVDTVHLLKTWGAKTGEWSEF